MTLVLVNKNNTAAMSVLFQRKYIFTNELEDE